MEQCTKAAGIFIQSLALVENQNIRSDRLNVCGRKKPEILHDSKFIRPHMLKLGGESLESKNSLANFYCQSKGPPGAFYALPQRQGQRLLRIAAHVVYCL